MAPAIRPEGCEQGAGAKPQRFEPGAGRSPQAAAAVGARATDEGVSQTPDSVSTARTRPRAIAHHEHTEIPAHTASNELLFPQLHTPHRLTRAHVTSPTRTDEIDGTSEVRQWPSAASTTGNDEPPAEPTYRTTVVAYAVWTLRCSTVTDAVYRLVFGLGGVSAGFLLTSPSLGVLDDQVDGALVGAAGQSAGQKPGLSAWLAVLVSLPATVPRRRI